MQTLICYPTKSKNYLGILKIERVESQYLGEFFSYGHDFFHVITFIGFKKITMGSHGTPKTISGGWSKLSPLPHI